MKKQTAVQWLMYQMLACSIHKETEEMYIKLPKDAFKQAKSMEKEQMRALYGMWMVNKKTMELYDFEEYYNETFGLSL